MLFVPEFDELTDRDDFTVDETLLVLEVLVVGLNWESLGEGFLLTKAVYRQPGTGVCASPRAALAAAHGVGVRVSIPSIVVAETVRGTAKDALVNRVINAVGEVLSVDEEVGRIAGALLGPTNSRSTIDASSWRRLSEWGERSS